MHRLLVANTLLAVGLCAAGHVGATETLNLSYADAAITGYDGCMAVADLGWMAKDPYQLNDVNGCMVQFAVPVPVGHSIKQIALLHGTACDNNQPCWNNTIETSAYLFYKVIAGQLSGYGDEQFYWSSPDPVLPLGSIQTSYLMTQSRYYPDAFTTQLDRTYHVTVEVHNFSYVAGLQITYE